jgi:hypothetical protein
MSALKAFAMTASASRFTEIGSPAIAFISLAAVLMPAVPGGVVIIVAVGVVAVAGISIVPQPEGVTGGITITGIIKPRIIGTGIIWTGVIIIVTVIALIIIIDCHSSAGDAPVESIVPSLLVRIVRFESGRVFFKDKGSVACREAPAVATLHKAHLVGRRLLCANHGIHLCHAGGLQRRWPLIPGLIRGNNTS